MQKLARFAALVAGALLVFLGIILLGVNLYVQSQGTQARIEQELRQRLGTSLHIDRISVTPWSGLKLTGITIPQTNEAGAAKFLEAKTLALWVRLWSLFSKRLVIRQISVVEPAVTWPQNADGKWRLPGTDQAVSTEAPLTPEPTVAQIPSPSITPEPSVAGRNVPPIPEAARTFVPEVRRVSVVRGSFRFLDRAGNLVAAFEDVGFRSYFRNGIALRGIATVEKVSLRDRFYLEQLKSPLRYEPAGLEFSQIAAHAGGGDITGHFAMQPQTQDSPFSLEVKFRNVEADRIISEAGGPNGVLTGKLDGGFQAAGKTADATALTGSGEIILRNGQVRQYSLLTTLGQILQIQELSQLQLEQAEAKYHVNPGAVTVDDLKLQSPNIRLFATGTIGFNGKLHLASKLSISQKVRDQLFKAVRANFQASDEPGYFAVDFEITGTVEKPRSNLLEKVMGGNLKDLVNSLFGGRGERPKKKRAAEGTTPSEPTASPAPSP